MPSVERDALTVLPPKSKVPPLLITRIQSFSQIFEHFVCRVLVQSVANRAARLCFVDSRLGRLTMLKGLLLVNVQLREETKIVNPIHSSSDLKIQQLDPIIDPSLQREHTRLSM